MDSYLIDIILIILAVVIILHFVFNNSLFDNESYTNNLEAMECIPKIFKPNENKNKIALNDTKNESSYYVNRDPGTRGIDRTNISKPWYHVANKFVNTNGVQDSNNSETDNSSNNTNNSESFPLIQNKCNDIKNSNLIFYDNYDGKLTSDPYERTKENSSSFTSKVPDPNKETMIDAYGNKCSIEDTSKNMIRYIREYVLDGRIQCECPIDKSKSEFTREEIDAYREEQLQFSDKINGTSAPAIDPVDKMNLITLNGGIKANGESIAKFYDNLVKNESSLNQNDPEINTESSNSGIRLLAQQTQNCIKPPIIETTNGIPMAYYMDQNNVGGKNLMRDNWMYNNENPNNGGIMFEGLRGEDPLVEYNRLI